MKIKAVIFDFDGVIHDTFNFHKNKVEEFAGVKMTENEFRDIHNGNFFANKNDLLKGLDWSGYPNFVYNSQSTLKVEEGIKKGILILSKKYDLFIITSGGNKNIRDYLDNNGMGGIFKEILGQESHRSKIDKFNALFKKYSLNPDNSIFVTDTLGDILEANEIGINTIAVDFGYHPKETLENGNPYKIVSKFDDILNILE